MGFLLYITLEKEEEHVRSKNKMEKIILTMLFLINIMPNIPHTIAVVISWGVGPEPLPSLSGSPPQS